MREGGAGNWFTVGRTTVTEKLVIERRSTVAILRLNRPKVLNALDGDLNRAISNGMRELEEEGSTKVVVVSGAGERAFSAGADLNYMRKLAGAGLRRFSESTWTPIEALANSPLISVAALHGHVLGGGAELALGCDLRVAARNLSFGFPEMVLGSLPGSSGMQRLPELVGRAKALELVTLGTRINAQTALTLGLVNAIANEGLSGEEFAINLAEEIAERPAESLRYAKIAMRMTARPDVAASFHALVSSVRHPDPEYRDRTNRFERTAPMGRSER